MSFRMVGRRRDRERRHDMRRHAEALYAEIDGLDLPVSDLSLGGLALEGYDGDRAVGDTLNLVLHAELDGEALSVPLRAEVARLDAGAGRLGLHFAQPIGDAYDVLERLVLRRRS